MANIGPTTVETPVNQVSVYPKTHGIFLQTIEWF